MGILNTASIMRPSISGSSVAKYKTGSLGGRVIGQLPPELVLMIIELLLSYV